MPATVRPRVPRACPAQLVSCLCVSGKRERGGVTQRARVQISAQQMVVRLPLFTKMWVVAVAAAAAVVAAAAGVGGSGEGGAGAGVGVTAGEARVAPPRLDSGSASDVAFLWEATLGGAADVFYAWRDEAPHTSDTRQYRDDAYSPGAVSNYTERELCVCGVVWCGAVWNAGVCGVVWCGAVWRGVAWCGVVWCGVVWCGVVWCGVVWVCGLPAPVGTAAGALAVCLPVPQECGGKKTPRPTAM
jgi:hypothetical protein